MEDIMTKREFLEILRQSLTGEVRSDIIEQNINYYDQYITSQSDEVKAINELGDPRLIARTIIETDKAAKQKGKLNDFQNGYSDYRAQDNDSTDYKNQERQRSNIFFTNIKWYHKLAFALAIILIFVIIAFIGSIIIRFLFAFIVPILIILLLISIFRRR